MSKAGSKRELEVLHGLLTSAIRNRLEEIIGGHIDGLTPSMISSVHNFLKDNGVLATASTDEALDSIREQIMNIRKKTNQAISNADSIDIH